MLLGMLSVLYLNYVICNDMHEKNLWSMNYGCVSYWSFFADTLSAPRPLISFGTTEVGGGGRITVSPLGRNKKNVPPIKAKSPSKLQGKYDTNLSMNSSNGFVCLGCCSLDSIPPLFIASIKLDVPDIVEFCQYVRPGT